MKTTRRIAAASVAAFFLGLFPGLPVAAEATDPLIPGTEVPLTALVRDLEWTFDVEVVDAVARRTLDVDGEGPAATRVESFRMRSTRPVRRTSSGAEYLRFGLTVYAFERDDAARQALDSFKVWSQQPLPLVRFMCKGATYRVQQGPLVYELDAGCQFSRQHYDLLVSRLEEALQGSGSGIGHAIQCYCGGGWVERSL